MHQGSYNGLHGLGKGKAKVQIFDTIKFAEEHTIDRIYGS